MHRAAECSSGLRVISSLGLVSAWTQQSREPDPNGRVCVPVCDRGHSLAAQGSTRNERAFSDRVGLVCWLVCWLALDTLLLPFYVYISPLLPISLGHIHKCCLTVYSFSTFSFVISFFLSLFLSKKRFCFPFKSYSSVCSVCV